MDSTFKLVVAVAILLCFSGTAARVLESRSSMATRLKVDGGEGTCWESLFELRYCTPEVMLFFLNGETYLGPGCCRAIRTIEHDCWPDLLTSLGYTSEEGDVLYGYCDLHSAVPPLPPVPVPEH